MKKILLYGDIDVNCYILERHNKCYIIDPGYEKERIINYIQDNNLEVKGILLTHAHIDHIGAIDSFKVPVYLHEKELEILKDNHRNGFEFYGKEKPYELEDIDIVPINENTVLELEDKQIEVIFTPGHTVGCVCYKIDNDLYTGDTLFRGTVGRWDFPTGNQETLRNTIVNLIESMKEDIVIHPAHGESSTIGDEKRNNYFYLEWKK